MKQKHGYQCWDTLGQGVGGGPIGISACHHFGGNQVCIPSCHSLITMSYIFCDSMTSTYHYHYRVIHVSNNNVIVCISAGMFQTNCIFVSVLVYYINVQIDYRYT